MKIDREEIVMTEMMTRVMEVVVIEVYIASVVETDMSDSRTFDIHTFASLDVTWEARTRRVGGRGRRGVVMVVVVIVVVIVVGGGGAGAGGGGRRGGGGGKGRGVGVGREGMVGRGRASGIDRTSQREDAEDKPSACSEAAVKVEGIKSSHGGARQAEQDAERSAGGRKDDRRRVQAAGQ